MADGPHPRWDTLDDFYLADHRRDLSTEIALPGVWYGEGWGERYDLLYLRATGEVAAIAASGYRPEAGPFAPTPRPDLRPVELICWCETEQMARRTISGWASHNRNLKSLYWLRRACRARDAPSVPPDRITAEHRDQAAAAGGSLF